VDPYGLRNFKGPTTAQKNLGVPQHNAFFEFLTVRDYLGLYATFKGVARNQIKKRVDTTIFKLELELIQKQLSSTL
jgi:ABC-type multidrug transport system ATPase subunit